MLERGPTRQAWKRTVAAATALAVLVSILVALGHHHHPAEGSGEAPRGPSCGHHGHGHHHGVDDDPTAPLEAPTDHDSCGICLALITTFAFQATPTASMLQAAPIGAVVPPAPHGAPARDVSLTSSAPRAPPV